MKRSIKISKILLYLLIVVCLFIFIACALASGIDIGHECTGDNCLICMAISLHEKAVHTLGLFVAVVSAFALVLTAKLPHVCAEQHSYASVIPVCLKVKLSN